MDSIGEKERAESVCGAEGKGLERECAGSWVCGGFPFFLIWVVGLFRGRLVFSFLFV